MTPSLEDVDLTSGRRHSPCPRPALLLYRLSGSERKRKGCPHTIRGPRGEAWLARRARAVAADGRAVAASRVVLCDAADRCGGTSEPSRGEAHGALRLRDWAGDATVPGVSIGSPAPGVRSHPSATQVISVSSIRSKQQRRRLRYCYIRFKL